MARPRFVDVYRINIAANPHDEGTYERLLSRASEILVSVRGSDWGKITKPRRNRRRSHILQGRILIWTEIDIDGRWIDLAREDELTADQKAQIAIPQGAKPNFRSFDYVFDTRKHTFYFEAKNDLDQSIRPKIVAAILNGALTSDALGDGFPEVAVTLVPEVGVVEEILNIPHLNTLYIKVVRPNPDGADPDAIQRVFAKLDALNAHQMEITLRKAADADRLTIEGEYEELAEVGAENGLVAGKGRQDGKRIEKSTTERPAKLTVEMDRGQDLFARLLTIIPWLD